VLEKRKFCDHAAKMLCTASLLHRPAPNAEVQEAAMEASAAKQDQVGTLEHVCLSMSVFCLSVLAFSHNEYAAYSWDLRLLSSAKMVGFCDLGVSVDNDAAMGILKQVW
jgi:hypothetical protein